MCSIFGLTSSRVPRDLIETCFSRTISRGPDMSRLEEIPGGILGFHRLAIMGLNEKGMQPFHLGKDAVVCNGELYGDLPPREGGAASQAHRGPSHPSPHWLLLQVKCDPCSRTGARTGLTMGSWTGHCCGPPPRRGPPEPPPSPQPLAGSSSPDPG